MDDKKKLMLFGVIFLITFVITFAVLWFFFYGLIYANFGHIPKAW